MKELAVLNQFFWKYKWRFSFGLLFVGLSNYFRVLQPQAIRQALDLIIENLATYDLYTGFEVQTDLRAHIGWLLLYFGGLIILFSLLMGLFMYFMRQTLIVMSHLITRDLRSQMYAQYQALSLAFYKRNKTGDLMSRITEDLGKVRMYLGPGIMYAVNLLIMFGMVIYAMLAVSPTLTFYSLLPLPILSVSIYFVNRVIHYRSTQIQQQLSRLSSIAQETYSGVRVVKSYAKEEAMSEAFAKDAREYKRRSISLSQVDAIFRPLMLMLIGASTIVTVYVGGLLVMSGDISEGNIAEFVIYINMLTWPVASIGWVASLTQQAAAAQKRINEFLLETPAIVSPIKELVPRNYQIRGDISFKNVGFTYPDTGIRALDGVSFDIKAGEKVAIVGRTGSGKTSIADLLLRLYDCTEGVVQIDGHNIGDFQLSTIRNQTGYVPQDVFLFSDTIANNINFNAKMQEFTPERIEQYAEYAAIRAEITELPQGFGTVVGERGVTLSGGQKQRVSIARALLNSPNMIILDDCLSAVDVQTEAKIANALNEVCAGKTTIIITHRLYSALQFDKIIVLEQGKISHIGTHEELSAIQNSYYAEIYEQQRAEGASISEARKREG